MSKISIGEDVNNILPLVIYMVHDYSFFGSTADFVVKKEHLRFLPDLTISKLQTLGRNMTIELDSRHPLLPKLDGKMKI
jgi:hypothetical protein